MLAHQIGKQGRPFARVRLRLPAFNGVATTQGDEGVELAAKAVHIGGEMGVVLQQQFNPRGVGHGQPIAVGRLPHVRVQGLGHTQLADLAALAFDPHRPRRVERAELLPKQAVESFLARLGLIGQAAQDGAAVAGQTFQIEHLRALGRKRMQQAGLAAAGAATDHMQIEGGGLGQQGVAHFGAVGLVAAFQLAGLEADLAEKPAHRARALAAAPAVHQRPPGAGEIGRVGVQMRRDIAGHQRCAALACLER